MAAYFFDSSALVKRYVNETGSGWVQTITDAATGHEIYIARITTVEVIAALVRRARSGNMDALTAATALEINDRLRAQLLALGLPINTYPCFTVSSDIDLNTAAIAEGLAVEDPNVHP
jgi:predicted nucleic acid-binding protein